MKKGFNSTAGHSLGEEGVRESKHRGFVTSILCDVCWISQICTCKLLGFTTHFRHINPYIVSVTVLYNLINSIRFFIKIFFPLCRLCTKEKLYTKELRVYFCFWRVLYQLTPTDDNYTMHLVWLTEWSILWTQQLRQQIFIINFFSQQSVERRCGTTTALIQETSNTSCLHQFHTLVEKKNPCAARSFSHVHLQVVYLGANAGAPPQFNNVSAWTSSLSNYFYR